MIIHLELGAGREEPRNAGKPGELSELRGLGGEGV